MNFDFLPDPLPHLLAAHPWAPRLNDGAHARVQRMAGATAMTPERLREIVAAMRSPEGCACSPSEMSDAFLMLAEHNDNLRQTCEDRGKAMEAAEAFGALAVAEIRRLLASAHPHPKEHPTMTAAWTAARAFLAEHVEP